MQQSINKFRRIREKLSNQSLGSLFAGKKLSSESIFEKQFTKKETKLVFSIHWEENIKDPALRNIIKKNVTKRIDSSSAWSSMMKDSNLIEKQDIGVD